MKKIFLLSIVVTVIAQGCVNSSKKKALDYNDKLLEISKYLQAKGLEAGKKLSAAMQSGNYSEIKVIDTDMLDYIDSKITAVKNMDDVNGSANLQKAMLDFLAYEKVLINEGLKPFEKLDSTTSQEDLQAASRVLQQKADKENGYLDEVRKAQKEYAEKNGVRYESPK